MRRPHRRGTDVDQDPYESSGRLYEPAPDLYETYPPRGRSPGTRRRNRSEPAATAAVYDDFQHDPEPREQPSEHRDSRKHRKAMGPDVYAAQSEPRQDRKGHRNRYCDDETFPSRARSHGRSAREYPVAGHYRAADDHRDDYDAYAPASRRGRERQHAYHPPRTSDTRRSMYSDFEAGPRKTDRRHSRYANYDDADPRTAGPRHARHQEYDAEPRGSDRRHPRYADYEAGPRSQPRVYSSQGRGRYRNDSPDRYVQPSGPQRSGRGRSMPRKGGVGEGGVAVGARPRAKSAVGYAALGEAAQTAFRVGSQAALQMRSEPGPWIGEKGTRVATAALGAALVDTFVGHKATGMKGGMRHQALRQACEMGIRNFVIQPTVNTATRRSGSGGGNGGSGGRRRH